MYANGQGVAQDYIHAHMWLNLSAVSGEADKVKIHDVVAKQMTLQQIAAHRKWHVSARNAISTDATEAKLQSETTKRR
jgi:hypothetical protein